METLVIFLAQTKTAAIIEIILLLVAAGIIGFVSAWLYYRSVYTKKINVLESEKDKLNRQIDKLNEDNSNLKKTLREKENEIEKLNEEISGNKGHHKQNED